MLKFTGERFTPECEREIAYEHWHRYAWLQPWITGKRVLDAACGEGYGSHLLSCSAASVVGVDLSEQSISHARQRYRADNLSFMHGDCLHLPVDDDTVDVVVSFETLEHLAEQDELLTEFRRVLRPDGFLVISSPDRKAYSDDTGYVNPFHVKELYRDEFTALIEKHFPAWRLFGQKLAFSSVIWSLDGGPEGAQWQTLQDDKTVVSGEQPALPTMYLMAIAALNEQAFPSAPGQSLFGDVRETVYGHYYDVIRKHIKAEQQLAERETELEEWRRQLDQPWWKRWFAKP